MGSEPRDPGLRPRGPWRSRHLSTDEETEAREGGACPHRVTMPKVKSKGVGPGALFPRSPMRQVGAGYHVTGVPCIPSQMGTRKPEGARQVAPESPSPGEVGSGLGPGSYCQAPTSHSFFFVNRWDIPPPLGEQGSWTARISRVTAQ